MYLCTYLHWRKYNRIPSVGITIDAKSIPAPSIIVRPSGCDLHGNNAARSARAKELDQVNTPKTGEGTTPPPPPCLRPWITPKRRRKAPPFLIYLLRHQFDTFGENLNVIVGFLLRYIDFCDVTMRRFWSKSAKMFANSSKIEFKSKLQIEITKHAS